MVKLNIGCGPKSRWIEDAEGLDIIDFGQEHVCSILDFSSDKQYDIIYIHHVVEHIQDQVLLFNKLESLLAKEGILDIRVPTLPHIHAFIDPTHVKFIPEQADLYFKYFTIESLAGHCYINNPLIFVSMDRDRYIWEAHIKMTK